MTTSTFLIFVHIALKCVKIAKPINFLLISKPWYNSVGTVSENNKTWIYIKKMFSSVSILENFSIYCVMVTLFFLQGLERS